MIAQTPRRQGYIQIYTGNGKGKTTAALGLTLRAAGAGLSVFIGQFLKSGTYSEIKALERLGRSVTLEQYGSTHFIIDKPTEEDKQRALHGLHRIEEEVFTAHYDVVILEEIFPALGLHLIPREEVLLLLDKKPAHIELVLTGRDAPPEFIEKADLVTEMREVKHYFSQGVKAREGIEK